MVSALDSKTNGPGSSPGRGYCVVFLRKILYLHSASFQPGVQLGINKFNAGGNPAMDYHPIQAGEGDIEIFLVASCYRNRDKLRSDGPLDSCADLTLPCIWHDVQCVKEIDVLMSTVFRQCIRFIAYSANSRLHAF